MISRMLTILALLVGLSTFAASQHSVSLTTAQTQPNFVVILVDDLDSDSVSQMPAVNRLMGASGATFTRFFATTPLCCPSRASILRGQYAHNHRVLRNTGEDAGFAAFNASGHEADTIATALDGAGYETALIGKYLNGYAYPRSENTYVPPGWDFWVAGVDHNAYNSFNYELNVNGEIVNHGRNERDYMTDVLSAHALDFLDRSAEADQPFFLYLAPYAPHSPSTPAPRHQGLFSGQSAPRGPAFNERNIQDKPDWVQSSRLSDARVSGIDSGYQDRLESLMAVDEMVDVVVERLNEHGVLESTYVLFLSDNGYFLGEHRQPHGKDAPYDAASRVPMMVRGPGIAAGSTVEKIALNIDLFPTIADLAGIAAPAFVDGRSLAPLLIGNHGDWREVALIEGFGKETESNEGSESSTPAFQALRSEHTMYAEYETGERELYDLIKDRHQISNIAREAPKSLLQVYSRRLDALAACAGSDCSRLEDEPLPKLSGKATGKGDDKGKAKGKGKGKGKGKDNDNGKDTAKGKTKERGKAKRRDGRAERKQLVGATVSVPRGLDSDPDERRMTVGGAGDAMVSLRLAVPTGAVNDGALHLRVHVASVTTGGALVATLGTSASAAGTGSARGSERLAGATIDGKGWVSLDISSALGDSMDLSIVLRGREGAEFAVSGSETGNPPQLVSGAEADASTERDGPRNRERENGKSVGEGSGRARR